MPGAQLTVMLLGMFRLEKRLLREHIIDLYKYLMGGYKKDRPRLFLVVLHDRTRGDEHKLKDGKSKHFSPVVEHRKVAQRGCRVAFFGDVQNTTGYSLGQLASADPS